MDRDLDKNAGGLQGKTYASLYDAIAAESIAGVVTLLRKDVRVDKLELRFAQAQAQQHGKNSIANEILILMEQQVQGQKIAIEARRQREVKEILMCFATIPRIKDSQPCDSQALVEYDPKKATRVR